MRIRKGKPNDIFIGGFGMVLSAAWVRYAQLFNDVPHGTAKQMAAMLQLIPVQSWKELMALAEREQVGGEDGK
jgi:hypothetical protein